MEYQNFISIIAQNQTKRLKPVNLPESSSPNPIPEDFQVLLVDMLKIIESHFEELCAKKRQIAIFGFQPTGIAIESDFPLINNRIFSRDQKRSHLSCVLYYLPVDDAKEIKAWEKYKSIVIDFTSGLVVNNAYYLCTQGIRMSGSKVYGHLPEEKLNAVWKAYTQST